MNNVHRYQMDSYGSGQNLVVDSFKHYNEPFKGNNFLFLLSN